METKKIDKLDNTNKYNTKLFMSDVQANTTNKPKYVPFGPYAVEN